MIYLSISRDRKAANLSCPGSLHKSVAGERRCSQRTCCLQEDDKAFT